ncbi:MAG: hypothetical protein WCK67_07705 [bacterium]
MLNINTINNMKQLSLNPKVKKDEKLSINLNNNSHNTTHALNNFQVGQAMKSSLLISFKGQDDEAINTPQNLSNLNWDTGEEDDELKLEENEKLSWDADETETMPEVNKKTKKTEVLTWDSRSNRNERPKRTSPKLSKEDKKEIERNKVLDQLVWERKTRNFFNTVKVTAVGSLLAAGAIFAKPYIPVIQKQVDNLSNTVELVNNPQCAAPSVAAKELLKPTPSEFLKKEGDTSPDPYHLKTTDICISKTKLDQLNLVKSLVESKEQYLKLSSDEIQTFNAMRQKSPSYMEVDHEGNRQSLITFLPKPVKLSDGRVLPEGTVAIETYINRGVNNSKKIELMAFIDPTTGFIDNVEQDLVKNMPKEFAPKSLEGLQEVNNAARQTNETIKEIISRYNAKDNPDVSDTLIPQPHSSSFFKVRPYDLDVLDQTLLKNNHPAIIYKNDDGTVNMIFARAENNQNKPVGEQVKGLFNKNPFGEAFKGFTDKIQYSFVLFDKGAKLPENASVNDPHVADEISDKVKSFVFVTNDGTIGIISKDGIYIPPLNTLDFNKDSFAEMLSVKEQVHSMRQQLFEDGKLANFSELLEGNDKVTNISRIDYQTIPNAVEPDVITALHASFIGKDSIVLNGQKNMELLALKKHRDFDSKSINYEFSVNPIGSKVYTGTINESGQIGFNNPAATQFETDTVKRRVRTLIESVRNQSNNITVTNSSVPTK